MGGFAATVSSALVVGRRGNLSRRTSPLAKTRAILRSAQSNSHAAQGRRKLRFESKKRLHPLHNVPTPVSRLLLHVCGA